MKIFVLTSVYNLYDQHGAYFIKAFATKPSAEEIKKAITTESSEFISDQTIDNLIKNGGGRMGTEDVWWYLEEVII